MRKSIMYILTVMALAAVLTGMTACAGLRTNGTQVTGVTTGAPAGYKSAKGDANELPQTGTVGGYEYSVMKTEYYGEGIRKNRGYYLDTLDEPDAPYFIFVCSGEKSTGGYSIEVSDILVNDRGEMTVVVEETSSSGGMVTEAFTAPYCGVTLKECPADVKVVDIYGNQFDCINDD